MLFFFFSKMILEMGMVVVLVLMSCSFVVNDLTIRHYRI